MGLWEFLAVICIAAMIAEAYKHHTKSKRHSSYDDLIDRIEALEARLGDKGLEQRVRALEAIVTDERYELDRKINSL